MERPRGEKSDGNFLQNTETGDQFTCLDWLVLLGQMLLQSWAEGSWILLLTGFQ